MGSSMSTTGYTLELKLEDPRTNRASSGMTCILYNYGVVITGYTIQGTIASGVTSGASISGTTQRWGTAQLTDIGPGVYTVIARGRGYPNQILVGYERVEVGPLIRGHPDLLQMRDSTGGTHYVYVTTGGTVAVSSTITGAT